MLPVYFFKIKDNAKLPIFGHNDITNAAVDIYSCIDKNIIIWPKSSKIISTGIGWFIDIDALDNFLNIKESNSRLFKLAMVIQSRSGLAINKGIECSNAGVIDEGYIGEIKVKLYNNTWIPKMIKNHERIAQGVIELLPLIELKEIKKENIKNTSRGNKGFGSSGTN